MDRQVLELGRDRAGRRPGRPPRRGCRGRAAAQPLMAPPRKLSTARSGSLRFASPPPPCGAAARATDGEHGGKVHGGNSISPMCEAGGGARAEGPEAPREARHTTEPSPPPQGAGCRLLRPAVYGPRSVLSTPLRPLPDPPRGPGSRGRGPRRPDARGAPGGRPGRAHLAAARPGGPGPRRGRQRGRSSRRPAGTPTAGSRERWGTSGPA